MIDDPYGDGVWRIKPVKPDDLSTPGSGTGSLRPDDPEEAPIIVIRPVRVAPE